MHCYFVIVVNFLIFICSFGQLPRECTLDKEVFDYECCPNTTLGVCGGPTRGSCEDIRDRVVDRCQNINSDDKYCKFQNFLQSRPGTGNTDFRYRWPTQIFERVCVCNGNYGGYNCMRCKRGYTSDDCSQPSTPVVRKSILSFTEAERRRFLDIIQMTKSVKASGYTVPIREPVTTSSSDSFVEISLYDIFATFHYNTIRDEKINECPADSLMHSHCNNVTKCPVPDFGHEGPTFLTWHRGYMLYVETEIQKMLNDPTFALPYWDWSDENRDEIWDLMGTSNCGVFLDNTKDEDKQVDVGPFTAWDAICTDIENIICNEDNQMCNPTDNPKKIERCIGGTEGIQCLVDRMLPSTDKRELNKALMERSYDMSPYNKGEETEGFRNALEGFRKLENDRNEDLCLNINVVYVPTELHNRVHIYIGGLMQEVPTASNDPIFFLHHCNVDRLYEEWLDQYSDQNFPSYKPSSFSHDVGPGHNIDEYLVPIFPLITNRDMHTRATSLGYTYKERDREDDNQGSQPRGSQPPPRGGTQDSDGCMGKSQMV